MGPQDNQGFLANFPFETLVSFVSFLL
jgi:hypothetical protein